MFAQENLKQKATIHTHEGKIEILLDSKRAPNTVKRFIDFSNRDLYNQTVFKIIIQGFFSKTEKNSTLDSIALKEAVKSTPLTTVKSRSAGIIAMLPLKQFVGYQFYITHTQQEVNLINSTVFGEIISGFDVLTRLEKDDPILYINITSN